RVAALKPAFKKEGGSVTAGNASGINDGAAAVVVMSDRKAKELRLTPLATIRAYASAGVDPSIMGMGPWPASEKALARAKLRREEIDLWELNEAFAAQSLGVLRELRIPKNRVNVHGGAIALGHPIGASGARVLVTLLHAMAERDARLGVASLCIGGGRADGEAGARGRARRHLRPAMAATVAAHRRAGHLLVILTSATRYLAEPVAADLGIEHLLVTQLLVRDGRFTGEAVRPVCYGE